MLDRTLNVQCNGASQWLCYSRRDLRPVNQLRCRQNEPRSFQKGEHMSEKEKFCWRRTEVREMFSVNVYSMTLKILNRIARLLMRAPVTTLVVSQEADDLLSAVVGNHTNIVLDYELWVLPVGVDVFSSGQPVVCCPVLIPWLLFTRSSIHHSILRFGSMVSLTKIPNPHRRQAEWPNVQRTSCRAVQWKPNSPTKHPKLVFTLQSQTTIF